jgi:histidinol-phosphate/aromatic aminotransferase/cobyric acid decarboxylase-like protein
LTHEHDAFALDLQVWAEKARGVDMAVLVNPNNPTGHFLNRTSIEQALSRVPRSTRVLIDEAYIDYVSRDSTEGLLNRFPNLLVLKSLSKCFALSGLRVAYLAGDADQISELRRFAPPWWVSLPAQVAAMAAFADPDYYRQRFQETIRLRSDLTMRLQQLGFTCFGCGNWVLARIPGGFPATNLVQTLAREKIFVRHAGATAPSLGDSFVRIAVRDEAEQAAILRALEASLHLSSAIPV